MSSLSQQIKEYAHGLGIHDSAFTSADPLDAAAGRIRHLCGTGHIPAGYFSGDEDITKACTPRAFNPAAQSVLVAALSYKVREAAPEPAPLSGTVAPYACRNYYRILRKKLEKVAAFLKQNAGASRIYLSCNGMLREKPLAERSGLGYYGNHGAIITEGRGSLVVLGLIVADCAIEEDRPLQKDCGSCRLCIDACPTGALQAPGLLAVGECLQYISQQPSMPHEFRKKWGTRFFGCSLCQDVCPHNLKAPFLEPPPGTAHSMVPLIPFLDADEAQYRQMFQGTQMGARWMSLGALKKNALVALGNYGDNRAIGALSRVLRQGDDLLREHAAWALEALHDRKARAALEKALEDESCRAVHDSVRDLLNGREKGRI